jgi:hypothetical protein
MVISPVEDDSKSIFGTLQPVVEPAEVVLSTGVVRCASGGYHLRFVFSGQGIKRFFAGVGLVACACLFWLAPAASAAGSPQDSGVYDQYTEQIPTAGGSHHSGSGPTGPGSGSSTSGPTGSIVLPANLTKEGGKDAKALREVATSPRYGAPDGTAPLPESSAGSPAALSAAVGAVTDGSDGRMIGLFVALLAVTAVSLGIAAARRA